MTIPNESEKQSFSKWELPDVAGNNSVAQQSSNATKISEKIRQDAYDQGLALGRAEGLQQAENEILSLKEELNRLIGIFGQAVNLIDESIQQQLFVLIEALVSKLTAHQFRCEPHLLRELILECKNKIPEKGSVYSIMMNPHDADVFRTHMVGDDFEDVTITPQNDIQSGGFILKTDANELDARINIRLQQLIENLYGKKEQTSE